MLDHNGTSQGWFIDTEKDRWGEDVIDDLIERGFEPVLVSDAAGSMVKWVWKMLELNLSVSPVSDRERSSVRG